VAAQFATIPEAGRGCDLLVGCGALQVAAPSVAELLGIRYVHAHYCPITLPSPHHAPPPLGWPVDEAADNRRRWEGVAHALGMPTAGSLATALGRALEPDVAARGRSLRPVVRTDGALAAARRLTGERP
jgi:vancomycin aglycone glucosyltransferase